MKKLHHFIVFTALLFLGSSVLRVRAEDKWLESEGLGKITLGQTSANLIKLVGQPKTKGEDTLWGATGEWVQEWKFPAEGLLLNMASEKQDGVKTVLSITAGAGCKLGTMRGIKIGSSESAVREAYKDVEDKSGPHSKDTFVAGSVYGGVIFHFKDGKVTEIFIGAAAE